jgi:hypothetical protein
MADRSSAYLFATIFELIDEHVPAEKKHEIAKRYWKMSQEYDFSNYQLESDETLVRLGLARIERDHEDPEYPRTIYMGDREW